VVFSHDTEVALQTAAALVNSDESTGDRLASPSDLDRFIEEWRVTGNRRRDLAEFEAVRALRPRLRRLWQLDEDGAVDEVNRILGDTRALPQLVRHDGWEYHLHATQPETSLADRMAVEVAMAFVDVIRQNELDRLRICDANDCDGVVVDLSKNRSRRYCSATCSSRVNVAAFRARHR